jgi:hypothetical protein
MENSIKTGLKEYGMRIQMGSSDSGQGPVAAPFEHGISRANSCLAAGLLPLQGGAYCMELVTCSLVLTYIWKLIPDSKQRQ